MKVLIVVDMQNDFVSGVLGTVEAQNIVPNVADKIRDFDGTVIFTFDTHYEGYLSTQEGKNLPVLHCIEGTQGWELNPAIQTARKNKKDQSDVFDFYKPTFGSVELAERLKEIDQSNEIKEIELVGVCTDICVISNALLVKAFLPEVPVFVDASCCAGVTPVSHANALSAMQACQIQIKNWEC